jgi:hypothetical protein
MAQYSRAAGWAKAENTVQRIARDDRLPVVCGMMADAPTQGAWGSHAGFDMTGSKGRHAPASRGWTDGVALAPTETLSISASPAWTAKGNRGMGPSGRVVAALSTVMALESLHGYGERTGCVHRRNFMTALMNAVKSNDVDAVRTLIQQGVNVNELDTHNDAPLIMAAYAGHTDIVRLLLEAGADVAVVDPSMKATALHAAAYAGNTDAAKLLIAYKIDMDKQGPFNGYTALHDAIWQNHVDTAKILIESGANLRIQSNAGQTPLALANSRNRREIVALIEQQIARTQDRAPE